MNKATATEINIADYNPLIDPDGDTRSVSYVLEALQNLIGTAEDIGQASCYGIAAILDVCDVALRRMQEAKP